MADIKNLGGRPAEEDTSPLEIQAIRRAFIEQFMRTRYLDGWMHEQLLAYAITQRKPDPRFGPRNKKNR